MVGQSAAPLGGGFNFSQTAQTVPAYANPGTAIKCSVGYTSPTTFYNVLNCPIRGYLVDAH
jgi:hypothetical protein